MCGDTHIHALSCTAYPEHQEAESKCTVCAEEGMLPTLQHPLLPSPLPHHPPAPLKMECTTPFQKQNKKSLTQWGAQSV